MNENPSLALRNAAAHGKAEVVDTLKALRDASHRGDHTTVVEILKAGATAGSEITKKVSKIAYNSSLTRIA